MVACYAILHCYFVDMKLQKSKGGGPKNAPPELKKFLIRDDSTESVSVEVSDSFDSVEEAKKQKIERRNAKAERKAGNK